MTGISRIRGWMFGGLDEAAGRGALGPPDPYGWTAYGQASTDHDENDGPPGPEEAVPDAARGTIPLRAAGEVGEFPNVGLVFYPRVSNVTPRRLAFLITLGVALFVALGSAREARGATADDVGVGRHPAASWELFRVPESPTLERERAGICLYVASNRWPLPGQGLLPAGWQRRGCVPPVPRSCKVALAALTLPTARPGRVLWGTFDVTIRRISVRMTNGSRVDSQAVVRPYYVGFASTRGGVKEVRAVGLDGSLTVLRPAPDAECKLVVRR